MLNTYKSKWILQRFTALLLIPFTFWFIYNCISFQYLSYIELKFFFNSYINSTLFILMMTIMIIHSKIGCETIVQDYISSISLKKIYKFILNFISLLIMISVFVAIIKLNLTK